ncbi:MAG: hypothetical protein ABSF26_17385 [Thermoguttaceae bacterium]
MHGHRQQHVDGPAEENGQLIYEWTGAQRVDVHRQLADVGQQVTEVSWTLVVHDGG